MAVKNQEVILQFKADTSSVEKNIQGVDKGIQKTADSTSGLTNQLDKMTGGAISGFKNFSSGLKNGISGLKSFKVALAATGIGLLIVAIGTLVSYFTNTKKGAEQLQVATAALGAAFDVLKDRVSQIGGALVKFFTGDFKGALEDVKGSFEGITDEIIQEAKAASDLQRAMNALKDSERDFIKVRAETNKAIAETRLRVEDETLSYDDRVEALEKAIALEQQTAAEELRMAEERARIIRERIALGESLESDLDELAQAEARVIDMETASLRMQKRLEGERQSLLLQAQAERAKEKAEREKEAEEKRKAAEKEAEDKRKADEKEAEEREKAYQAELAARQKLEDELYKESLSAREKEELALLEQYDARIAIAGDDEGLIASATEAFLQRQAELEEKYRKAEMDAEQQAAEEKKKLDQEEEDRVVHLAQKRLDLAIQSIGALQSLNEAFSKDDEQSQKKAFARNKALGIAGAVLNTASAVLGAISPAAGGLGIPAGIPGAVLAAATGAAQIATISKSKYEGGSSATPSAPSTPTQQVQSQPSIGAPTLDLGFLGAGAGQSGPIQAYVLAENVSNAQQANQKIQDQATL